MFDDTDIDRVFKAVRAIGHLTVTVNVTSSPTPYITVWYGKGWPFHNWIDLIVGTGRCVLVMALFFPIVEEIFANSACEVIVPIPSSTLLTVFLLHGCWSVVFLQCSEGPVFWHGPMWHQSNKGSLSWGRTHCEPAALWWTFTQTCWSGLSAKWPVCSPFFAARRRESWCTANRGRSCQSPFRCWFGYVRRSPEFTKATEMLWPSQADPFSWHCTWLSRGWSFQIRIYFKYNAVCPNNRYKVLYVPARTRASFKHQRLMDIQVRQYYTVASPRSMKFRVASVY